MERAPALGKKVRSLRTSAGLSQAALAERLQVSPSYLNLIEHDRRPLTAPLLIRLAQVLDLDLRAIASEEGARIAADLLEVFADPLFEGSVPSQGELRELAVSNPELARAVVHLHHAYTATRDS